MQIMPPTWQELRIMSASATTVDRMTICFARTAYLRAKLDRFGRGGVFAAYKSGPYDINQEHVAPVCPPPRDGRLR
ncbi:hypothetical protein GCM10010869_55300 [Mesorhizobium tianshanense]|uniref:Uncharacterized protein n=2 Tax=Mesorhizobium tianshanense TaxID=39844 RepID=A0A562NC76_9HYPH|nr:hypothetical protein IQ26_04893 [Mesorhizobium tianshanense]GLS39933.1 hypothetical protein GCM10010869_55300 [Mesorhizobium tianshanense]